jgi:hypothetical protein
MKNLFKDIAERMQTKELVVCFLITVIMLFLAFVGYSTFSTIEIHDKWGGPHTTHITYYGFPFTMASMLTPIGGRESYWVNELPSGEGLAAILWGGLCLNFILYFSLSFAIVYTLRRLRP